VGFAKALAEVDKPYLDSDDDYFTHMRKRFEVNRNALLKHLSKLDIPLKMSTPEGGYFMIGNIQETVPKIPKKYFFLEMDSVKDGDAPINC